MKKTGIFLAAGVVALSMAGITCKEDSGPTGPITDTVPGNVVLSEGFEDGTTPLLQYTYAPGWGIMSRTTGHARTGSYSLTSDSNRTGIKIHFDIIADSIAGLQFYLMATMAEQVNFGAAIARSGSAWDGMFSIFGMGIGKSDSLQYIYQYQPDDPTNEQKNFAPLHFNKWYQCRIEYDFNTNTLTYFLDGTVVGTKTPPSVASLTMFLTMRDELGLPGPSGYYIDDISVYKR